MYRKKRKPRKNKQLDKLIDQELQRQIDEGLIEQLPGGLIRRTPKGIDEYNRISKDPEYQRIVSLLNGVKSDIDRGRDLEIKSAVLKTTRQIVAATR